MVKAHVRGSKVEVPGSSFQTMDHKFYFGHSDHVSKLIFHDEFDSRIDSERFQTYNKVF